MRSVICVILGLASFIYAPEASACSCMKLTPSEGFTSSYAVFTGEVIDIAKNEATRFGGLEVTLRVKKVWKGDPAPQIKVRTASSSAACGYGFAEGETYLVYAVRDEADPLRVSLCSRTAPIDQAKEDLQFLGKPAHTFEEDPRRQKAKSEDGRKRGCSAFPADTTGSDLAWLALMATGLTLGIRRLV